MAQRRPMTLTEKILFAHAIAPPEDGLRPGDLARIRVDWTIASELAWNGMNETYQRLGRPPIHDPSRFYLAVDHTVDPVTLIEDPKAKRLTAMSQDFAREAGLMHFYDANETILHTLFYRDLVQPGEIVLGADSHTSSHGGMGAFAIGLGGADITVAMVLGESWIEVPEAIRVEYRGQMGFGFTGKDVILKTLGELGRNTVAMERSVEYGGEAVRDFTPDMRFTIANMTAEFGGLNGIFEADGQVADWLSRRDGYNDGARYYRADADAQYRTRHVIDLSAMAPQIAKPFSPDNVHPVGQRFLHPVGQRFQQIFREETRTSHPMKFSVVTIEPRAPEHTHDRLASPPGEIFCLNCAESRQRVPSAAPPIAPHPLRIRRSPPPLASHRTRARSAPRVTQAGVSRPPGTHTATSHPRGSTRAHPAGSHPARRAMPRRRSPAPS